MDQQASIPGTVNDDPFADPKVVPLHPNGRAEKPTPARPKYPFAAYGPDELASLESARADWIVRGLLARGCVTELTADVRAGKTTFTAELVRAMRERRPFLGQPTSWTHVTWLTEERPVTFLQAMTRAGLHTCDSGEVCVIFRQDVVKLPWPALIRAVMDEDRRRAGGGLLVVDTLSRFVGVGPDQENDPAVAARAMEPLLEAAKAGMTIDVHRHARKSGGDIATSGRGSSAWSADCDIMLLLRKLPRPAGNGQEDEPAASPRHRLLEAASRFTETPAQDEAQVITLGPEGYGVVDHNSARQQRYQDVDEQVLLYLASHPGYTKTDARGSDLIRAKSALIDERIQALLDTGRLVERLTPRTDARGRSRQVAGLYLGPNA